MGAVVWLASYPKSGNTWLRLLLADLLSGNEEPVDINNIRLTGFLPACRSDAEEITLIDTALLLPAEVDQLRPYVIRGLLEKAGTGDQFAKVHDAYRRLPDGTPLLGRDMARAALYILRDPRDVAVSMSHYYRHDLDKAVAFINKGWKLAPRTEHPHAQVPQALLDWSSHVRSWTEQRDIPTHTLRYEDLLTDTAAALGEAATFLGLPVSPAGLERVARRNSLNELRRQESERGFQELPSWAGERFFRAGKAGGWVDALTRAQAAAITAAHGEMMAAYGYL